MNRKMYLALMESQPLAEGGSHDMSKVRQIHEKRKAFVAASKSAAQRVGTAKKVGAGIAGLAGAGFAASRMMKKTPPPSRMSQVAGVIKKHPGKAALAATAGAGALHLLRRKPKGEK